MENWPVQSKLTVKIGTNKENYVKIQNTRTFTPATTWTNSTDIL